jgi:hypothetical protein
MNKFKKGNEVKMVKDTFDSYINELLNVEPQVIVDTKDELNGQWVKTNHYNDWIHYSFFQLKKNKI